MHSISIFSMWKSKDKKVKEFLGASFPRKVQDFSFNYPPTAVLKPFKYYSVGLLKILSSLSRSYLVSGMKISQKEFQSLIYYSKHLDIIKFFFCDIETEGMRIVDDPDYRIKEINLHGTGRSNASSWDKTPTKFECFLKAISESSLMNSLKRILINDCHISEEDCREMMERQHITGIEVKGYYASFYSNKKYTILIEP